MLPAAVENVIPRGARSLTPTHGDNNRAELRETVTKQIAPEQLAQAEKQVKEFVPRK